MSDDLKRMALDAKGPMPRDPSFADPLLMFKDAATPDAILDLFRERDEAAAEITALRASLDAMRQERDDYAEALADKRRLAREIDVAMHGEEGAAERPSLCDLVGPARDLRAALSAKDEEVKRLREALEQAKAYVERDEVAHGRQFGTGNAIRAALSPRTAAMEHIAQELAEEIEEGRNA